MDRLTTEQAAARLGVKPETLYAYVSRGLIDRQRGPDGRSRFLPADVDRLAARSRRGGPAPVDLSVPSAITLVTGGRLHYRGRDAVDLCSAHPFEDVAGFLWTGNLAAREPWTSSVRPSGRRDPLDRLQRIAADAAGHTGTSPGAGRRLMASLVEGLPAVGEPSGDRFAERLWARLTSEPPTAEGLAALDLALGLSADHGLIRSTLVARIVAGSGGDLGSAVAAALGPSRAAVAASGFDEARRLFAGERVTIRRAERGAYPQGDPRTEPILEALRRAAPEAMVEVDTALDGLPRRERPPDAHVAVTAMERALRMRPGSAEVIVVVARAAGWIAHALEESGDPTPLRVRSVYTGPRPEPRAEGHRTLDAVLDYLQRTS